MLALESHFRKFLSMTENIISPIYVPSRAERAKSNTVVDIRIKPPGGLISSC